MHILTLFPCTQCYNAIQVEPKHLGYFKKSKLSPLFEISQELGCPICHRRLKVGYLYQLEVFRESTRENKIIIKKTVRASNLFIGNNNVGQIQTDAKGKFVIINDKRFTFPEKYLEDTSR